MDEVVEVLEKYQGLVPLVYDAETMALEEARPQDMQYAVYLKREADKVIADLEESHKMEVEQLLMEIVGLKAENKKLKEIKDKYSSCAKKAIDSIAKCELKIRSLSRALFKTCANWAWAEHVRYVDISDGSQGYKQVQERWEKMASKCIKKAREYK